MYLVRYTSEVYLSPIDEIVKNVFDSGWTQSIQSVILRIIDYSLMDSTDSTIEGDFFVTTSFSKVLTPLSQPYDFGTTRRIHKLYIH